MKKQKFITFSLGEKNSEFKEHWVLILHFNLFGIYISGLKAKILLINFLRIKENERQSNQTIKVNPQSIQ